MRPWWEAGEGAVVKGHRCQEEGNKKIGVCFFRTTRLPLREKARGEIKNSWDDLKSFREIVFYACLKYMYII